MKAAELAKKRRRWEEFRTNAAKTCATPIARVRTVVDRERPGLGMLVIVPRGLSRSPLPRRIGFVTAPWTENIVILRVERLTRSCVHGKLELLLCREKLSGPLVSTSNPQIPGGMTAPQLMFGAS